MPDAWIEIEEGALAVIALEAARKPPDRAELLRALQIFAIAKNRKPDQPMPDWTVFGDQKLVEMANALVSGNQLGA